MTAAVERMAPPHTLSFVEPMDKMQQIQDPSIPSRPAPSSVSPTISPSDTSRPSRQSHASPPTLEEGRKAYRTRSIETVTEANGDVNAFLEELEDKRRQLDDQIHRYIKQKEREFKLFERDLRIRYRTAHQEELKQERKGGDSSTSSQSQPGTIAQSSGSAAAARVQQQPDELPTDENAHLKPATRTNGSTKTKHSKKESELLGLFTPAFLPLLDGNTQPVQRSPSAPPPPIATDLAIPPVLARASSVPEVETALSRRPARLKLEQRTSSSGSDISRNLVSALKSPSGRSKLPKRKRVSLIVGDDIVAPSDNISAVEPVIEQPEPRLQDGNSSLPATGTEGDHEYIESISEPQKSPSIESLPQVSHNGLKESGVAALGTPAPMADLQTMDDELELDLASPFAMDEEVHNTPPKSLSFDEDEDQEEDEEEPTENVETISSSYSSIPIASASPSPATLRRASKDAASPTSHFRSASSASAQPVSPGFSRPSVQDDPTFTFDDDIVTPEIEDNKTYGSFNGSRGDDVLSSSLGESYMQRNAEKIMMRRLSEARRGS